MVSFYVSKKNGGRGKSKKNGEKKVTLKLFLDGEKKMGVGIFINVTGGIMVSLVSLGVGLFCASDVCFTFSGHTV